MSAALTSDEAEHRVIRDRMWDDRPAGSSPRSTPTASLPDTVAAALAASASRTSDVKSPGCDGTDGGTVCFCGAVSYDTDEHLQDGGGKGVPPGADDALCPGRARGPTGGHRTARRRARSGEHLGSRVAESVNGAASPATARHAVGNAGAAGRGGGAHARESGERVGDRRPADMRSASLVLAPAVERDKPEPPMRARVRGH